MMRKLLALAIVLLLPVSALAATHTVKYLCAYSQYVDQEGSHPTDLRLTFIMDLDKGTAYMLSKTGITQVWCSFTNLEKGGQTFIEYTPSGYIRTATVVYNNGFSAHQRKALIAGEWVTTQQYYGTCQRSASWLPPQSGQ